MDVAAYTLQTRNTLTRLNQDRINMDLIIVSVGSGHAVRMFIFVFAIVVSARENALFTT